MYSIARLTRFYSEVNKTLYSIPRLTRLYSEVNKTLYTIARLTRFYSDVNKTLYSIPRLTRFYSEVNKTLSSIARLTRFYSEVNKTLYSIMRSCDKTALAFLCTRHFHREMCQPGMATTTIIFALKGAIRDVFSISSLRRELSPARTPKRPRRNRVQITCNTSGAHHVQHVVRRMVRRDSSAIRSDRVSVAFSLALFYWLKRLTDEEGGGNRSTQRKPPTTNLRKCHILKPENSNPNRGSNPHTSVGGSLGKQTC